MTVLLLDLDRTLVDVQSFTDYERALADLRERFGELPGAATPETYWRPATVRAMAVLVALIGDARWQEASDLIESHEMAAVVSSTAMAGLGSFLEATRNMPKAVVTLMGPSAARATLDRHGIGADGLVGRRADLRPKPAADQLLAGALLLDVEPAACVMVGDSTWDRDAARAAGMRFVGVGRADFEDDTLVADDLGGVVELLRN